MRAVVGTLNDSCYLNFEVTPTEQADYTGIWGTPKYLIRGSQSFVKGTFMSTTSDTNLTHALLKYQDFVNHIEITFRETKLAPYVVIRTGLPNPDKYNVSEFFVKGHLEIEKINIVSRKKTVSGVDVMKMLRAGKKINMLDKLMLVKTGEPLVNIEYVETELGVIQQIKHRVNLDI